MRISPLFVRLSQLAMQAAERMPQARAALIQSTCSEAASTSGDTSITSGLLLAQEVDDRRGRPGSRARAAIKRALDTRAPATAASCGIAIDPVVGRRQHLALDPRAQRRRAGEARVQVADEIHDAAQPVGDRAPRALVLRHEAEHAHAIGVRLQSLEADRLLDVGVVDGNRHVVAARRAAPRWRSRRTAGTPASPRRTESS